MANDQISLAPSVRDLRVDFFRGLALWVIFWDHSLQLGRVEFIPFYCTPAFTTLSDAAELFVFLSGYVFGLVYMKTLVSQGFVLCYKKSLHRVWQIYRANAITFLTCFGVIWFFHLKHNHVLIEVDTLVETPLKLIPYGLLNYYLPFGFDILPLYMVLLCVMPFFLYLFKNRPKEAVLLSLAIYLTVQIWPSFNIPRYTPAYGSDGFWNFNVFAWQFIFFIGMALGARKRLGVNVQVPRRKLLIWAAILFIAVSPIFRASGVFFHLEPEKVIEALQSGNLYESVDELVGITEEDIYTGNMPNLEFPFTYKKILEPLRLLHFFSAVYLVVVLLPTELRFWKSRFAQPLCLCGRHSLEVFCGTILLNYIIGYLLQVYGGGALMFLLWSVLGFVLLTLFAGLLEDRKKSRIEAKS